MQIRANERAARFRSVARGKCSDAINAKLRVRSTRTTRSAARESSVFRGRAENQRKPEEALNDPAYRANPRFVTADCPPSPRLRLVPCTPLYIYACPPSFCPSPFCPPRSPVIDPAESPTTPGGIITRRIAFFTSRSREIRDSDDIESVSGISTSYHRPGYDNKCGKSASQRRG